MVANLINTLIGLWLCYESIFALPTSGQRIWIAAALGVVIAGLAWISRRTDATAWQSTTNIALGILLALFMLVHAFVPLSDLAIFWMELWVGLTVASLALWSVFYRPQHLKAAVESERLSDARTAGTAAAPVHAAPKT